MGGCGGDGGRPSQPSTCVLVQSVLEQSPAISTPSTPRPFTQGLSVTLRLRAFGVITLKWVTKEQRKNQTLSSAGTLLEVLIRWSSTCLPIHFTGHWSLAMYVANFT